ncbi:DUF3307 domain-containing protein [Exiguobacterium antarcticum]|uniref:DUF3307 domain-containing protein n=1 Tax=Exiguobacterium antarcticum TaxID=132920 RepID=A0ABT6R5Y1_9BACL|nr:DUF3307 domain-containing protein [Exiguobacterium antarcticum]MDI3236233.1 DUF3307 domain-containing protein [Exiguobacterium antarcticum]
MTLLLSLLLVHLLADFPLQSKRMAKSKQRQFRVLLAHISIHSIGNSIVLGLLYALGHLTGTDAALIGGGIVLTHLFLDGSPLKRILHPALAFWIDQLLHIGIVTGLVLYVTGIDWPTSFTLLDQILWIVVWGLVATELIGRGIAPLLAPFAPRLIESHFERKVTRKEQLDGLKRSVTHEVEDSARSYTTEINGVGRYIGLVERAIIVCLVTVNATGAIGFIIALKALARFKQFDDRRFAEYYIIGSLLSILGALLCGMAIRIAL